MCLLIWLATFEAKELVRKSLKYFQKAFLKVFHRTLVLRGYRNIIFLKSCCVETRLEILDETSQRDSFFWKTSLLMSVLNLYNEAKSIWHF